MDLPAFNADLPAFDLLDLVPLDLLDFAVGAMLDEGALLSLLDTWAGAPRPDLELVLDLDPARALVRRGAASDRIEDKGLAFQRRVAAGFQRYVERTPRAQLVAADGELAEVQAALLATIEERMGAIGGAA